MRIYWDIIDSNAWRCLSNADKIAYLALHRQKMSTNNGDLSLPLSVARHSGITSPATLAKSLRALVAVGLLAVTRKGGCKRGGQRLPTLYRFTDYEVYAQPMKNIEASQATNEWKAVKTLAMGSAMLRNAQDGAKKTQLQKLAVTASKNELVRAKTTSKNEAWPPSPASIIEVGEEPKTARKANASKGFEKLEGFTNSENHTSNNEVLSTVAIPMGESGLPDVGVTTVSFASADFDAEDVLATVLPEEAPAMISASHPGNAWEASSTACELATATDDAGEDF